MPEKEPQVTFTDRRKISSDGEIRPEAAVAEEVYRRETEQREAIRRAAEAAAPAAGAPPKTATAQAPQPSPPVDDSENSAPEGPSAQETAESQAAYRETTRQLDEMLRSKAPESAQLGPVGFEHLVQSMYMTAMMGLGAGTQPGEKPRIDLMGARQTIDLLAVLGDKTKGNLSPDEQRLLESALFELRMMFLEITNAIARNAANPAPGQPPPPRRKQ